MPPTERYRLRSGASDGMHIYIYICSLKALNENNTVHLSDYSALQRNTLIYANNGFTYFLKGKRALIVIYVAAIFRDEVGVDTSIAITSLLSKVLTGHRQSALELGMICSLRAST